MPTRSYQEEFGQEAEKLRNPFAEPLQSRSLKEFFKLELPKRGLVIDPILPERGLILVHAYRGIGKTMLLLAMGYTVATGGTLLTWSAPQPRRVLYIDGEMPAETMQERLAALVSASEKEPDEGYFHILSADDFARDAFARGFVVGGLPDLGTEEGQAAFDELIVRRRAEFIIVDNCSTLIRTGKENEGESWVPVQSWALQHRFNGRCIAFAQHDGKGGQQRGTSRREDVLDTVIGLKRPPDYHADQGACFQVVFEKSRNFHGEGAVDFEARYEVRDGKALWTRKEIADTEMLRVAALINEGFTIRDAAEELGMTKSAVGRFKQKAHKEGLIKEKDGAEGELVPLSQSPRERDKGQNS